MNKLREQGRAVFDRCGQVRAAASSASAPVGQPEGAWEGQPDQYEDRLKGKHHQININKLPEQGRTVFDRCGQVGVAASSASAPAGQPEGAWEGQPEGCERQDEAWPFLAWSLEPDEAWPSTDSGTWFPPTPDSWCCLPPDFRLFGP